MTYPFPDNHVKGDRIAPDESTRASRYHRPKPIPMHLTDRDEAVITRCWEDKLLSTSDLHTLFFGAKARCVRRLRILYSNHYLDRYFLPVISPYHGSTEALYTIGVKGSPIASMRLDQDQNYVALKRRELTTRMQSPSFLLTFRHLRAVIKTRLCFEQGFAQETQWQLLLWIPERLLEDQFTLDGNGTVRRVKLRADGFFQYQHTTTGRIYSAFVETDLGTMSHGQITAKVQRYLGYFQTPLPEHQFGTRWFRVLMMTTSHKRAQELWYTISQHTRSIFWLTSFDHISHPQWLTQRIWHRVGREGRYPLLYEDTTTPPVA